MLSTLVAHHFRLHDVQKKALARLNIETLRDLLYHFPTRYERAGNQKTIGGVVTGSDVVLFGTIKKPQTRKAWKSKRPMGEAWLEDGTGKIKLIWFNQPYMAKKYQEGTLVKITGHVEGATSPYIANPEIELAHSIPFGGTGTVFETMQDEDELFAVYPESVGISSRWFRHAVAKVLKEVSEENLPDPIPEEVRKNSKLPELHQALRWMHTPKTKNQYIVARKRFSFEEIFLIQITKQQFRNAEKTLPTYAIEDGEIHAQLFLKTLPFSLTHGQQRAVRAILEDMKKPPAMSRLLEGDVGSGKTVVAAATAYAVVNTSPPQKPSATLQVAYMAPTEILAEQHFTSFIHFFKHLPITIGLITSSGCKKFPSKVHKDKATKISKAQLLKWTAEGEVAILIGTHALVQKNVQFRDLGLVIIDEQHRFGVSQRQSLTRGKTRTERGQNAETTNNLLYSDITYRIREALFTVRNELGLGHQEKIYQRAVEDEFKRKKIPFQKEVQMPILYKEKKVGVYIPDFVVDNKIVIEMKTLTTTGLREKKQLWSYLKGSEYKLGLLVNFGTTDLQIEWIIYDTARETSSISTPHIINSDSALSPHHSACIPHLLSMTATPIPRTLALTLYGDLDLTVLDEMPPGRKQVRTSIIEKTGRETMYDAIKKELDAGRQAYVICPRIDEPDPRKAETLQTKSVKAEAEHLRMHVLKNYKIEVLHGQMKPQEKDDVMRAFLADEIDILVATSVVEVGVNVPNATSIIIEGAERFGLAQLHQLRGRVVRSNHQAYCYILTSEGTINSRLKALTKAKNGFELAELDLAIRGPGELYGKNQSGITDLGMDALKNIKMVEVARTEAQKLCSKDSTLKQYPTLQRELSIRKEKLHFE